MRDFPPSLVERQQVQWFGIAGAARNTLRVESLYEQIAGDAPFGLVEANGIEEVNVFRAGGRAGKPSACPSTRRPGRRLLRGRALTASPASSAA